ncbi:MAG: rod shape-determining protein MreD [Eubacteriales bacterium]|nr:rod shape-determining protein MreD [Eubacteriales bacterium]
MKRKITVILMIFFCFILQSTLFQQLAIASIAPNLLLIITVSFGFIRGKREGIWIGFLCGLLMDLSVGTMIGVNALFYTSIGYINGCFYHIFYDDDIRMPIFFVAVSDLAYGIAVYATMFLLRGRIDFFYYLRRIIIPEVLYTLVITILLYKIIYRLNQWLEKTELKG